MRRLGSARRSARRPPSLVPRRTRLPWAYRRSSRRRPRRRRARKSGASGGRPGSTRRRRGPMPRRPAAPGAWAPRGRGRRASLRRRRAWRVGDPDRARAPTCSGANRCPVPRTLRAAPGTRPATAGLGHGSGIGKRDLGPVADPSSREEVVHKQRGLARGRRALERRRGDRDDHPTSREAGEHVAQRERALLCVELVAALDETGRRRPDRDRPRARPRGCRRRTSRRRSRPAWRPRRSSRCSPARNGPRASRCPRSDGAPKVRSLSRT